MQIIEKISFSPDVGKLELYLQMVSVAYAGKNQGVESYGRPCRGSGRRPPPYEREFSKIWKKYPKKIAESPLF